MANTMSIPLSIPHQGWLEGSTKNKKINLVRYRYYTHITPLLQLPTFLFFFSVRYLMSIQFQSRGELNSSQGMSSIPVKVRAQFQSRCGLNSSQCVSSIPVKV
uniref:Uncharacterized protein n=1 Tax=Cacopsylla melanoneura TaxID=428564 RepID=A0A8D8RVG1_9HEMI